MKRMHSFHLWLSGILIILFSNCKKESNSPSFADGSYTISFNPKALDYVKLTEGKYLIYKDSATTSLDSVIVTASKLTTLDFPKQVLNNITYQAHTLEQFSLVLTKYSGSAPTEWFYGYARAVAIFAITDNNADMYLTEQPANSAAFAFTRATSSIPSMVIEGKAYNEVIVTESKTGVDINHP